MFELPHLPYAPDALQPYISRETLDYHHGKHHKTYVDKLNALTNGTEFEDCALEDIIMKASGPIFNNAAQHWNHSFYWHSLTPNSAGTPSGKLADAINQHFGSFDAFKKAFTESATGLFGSGWTWLVETGQGELAILNTANADLPMKHGKTALLTCDVWEHAYYIDYRNARPDYLKNYWEIVNWEFAAKNFAG